MQEMTKTLFAQIVPSLVKMQKRLVLTNTFFGFDPPMHIPPNLKVYGPGMQPYDPDRLQQASPELFDWMSAAEAAGQQVLVISIGTESVWQQWYIDAIMEGILKLNEKIPVRVVWGFK